MEEVIGGVLISSEAVDTCGDNGEGSSTCWLMDDADASEGAGAGCSGTWGLDDRRERLRVGVSTSAPLGSPGPSNGEAETATTEALSLVPQLLCDVVGDSVWDDEIEREDGADEADSSLLDSGMPDSAVAVESSRCCSTLDPEEQDLFVLGKPVVVLRERKGRLNRLRRPRGRLDLWGLAWDSDGEESVGEVVGLCIERL